MSQLHLTGMWWQQSGGTHEVCGTGREVRTSGVGEFGRGGGSWHVAKGAGGVLQAPTALFLVVSLTCKAPPRDPNQCELVDRPRYRKGPHICFDYNATVRGEQEGAELGLAPGKGWGQWVSSGGRNRAMVGSPVGYSSVGCSPGGNLGSGFPLGRGVEPWGDPRGAELRGEMER